MEYPNEATIRSFNEFIAPKTAAEARAAVLARIGAVIADKLPHATEHGQFVRLADLLCVMRRIEREGSE